MYAIIQIGAKQYKVKEGDVIKTEKIDKQPGEEFDVSDIILIGQRNNTQEEIYYGEKLKSATIRVKVLEHIKGKKITIIKFKPKKRYRRKKGHRQNYTILQIKNISLSYD
jgi:large subunit ribosomal protein L21